jgi:type I restriction enzyme M protein
MIDGQDKSVAVVPKVVARAVHPQDALARDGALERVLWSAADKLRSGIDAAEYKHVVLGLVFLKFVSSHFDEHRATLEAAGHAADLESPIAYRSARGFWVPQAARWTALEARAQAPLEGRIIDEALSTIELANPDLAGALPQVYARVSIDAARLGELVRLVGTIRPIDEASRSRDVLGRIYEYFLAQFASSEGQRGGQFYTPRSLVQLLVAMLAPSCGVVYDPCCGSGGMFVQSERFAREERGAAGALTFYGQESNATTFRLARMNMAIRGIEANLGARHADTLQSDLHPGLRADYILANPPFNAAAWGAERLRDDPRFTYGLPPSGNANYAWVQHILARLTPTGTAGFILANGALSSNQGSEAQIRRALVEADVIDCIVALPDRLFYSTQIAASLWIVTPRKVQGRRGYARRRAGETLFIDARGLGQMIDRTHRELSGEDIARVASVYRAFRGEDDAPGYRDEPGFCRVADREEIARHRFALVPGRFVGFARSPQDMVALEVLHDEMRDLDAYAEEVTTAARRALELVRKAALRG